MRGLSLPLKISEDGGNKERKKENTQLSAKEG
jgi:hypothetical protein